MRPVGKPLPLAVPCLGTVAHVQFVRNCGAKQCSMHYSSLLGFTEGSGGKAAVGTASVRGLF